MAWSTIPEARETREAREDALSRVRARAKSARWAGINRAQVSPSDLRTRSAPLPGRGNRWFSPAYAEIGGFLLAPGFCGDFLGRAAARLVRTSRRRRM